VLNFVAMMKFTSQVPHHATEKMYGTGNSSMEKQIA
jgi:hypothetical protein